jgi:hypothetical protein
MATVTGPAFATASVSASSSPLVTFTYDWILATTCKAEQVACLKYSVTICGVQQWAHMEWAHGGPEGRPHRLSTEVQRKTEKWSGINYATIIGLTLEASNLHLLWKSWYV